MDMQLIELVESHAILYDKSRNHFKDNAAKQKIWQKIGALLNKDASTVQRRWKVLRDRYSKERRDISSLASGAAASSASSWQFYAAMAFLETHFKSRNTSGNVCFREDTISVVNTDTESMLSPIWSEECLIEYAEHISNSPIMSPALLTEPSTSAIAEEERRSTPMTPSAQPSCSGKRRKRDEKINDIDGTLQSISSYFQTKSTKDSDLSFGHYVGLELKKLTNRKKNAAKIKILNIFAELEEESD